MEQTLKQIQKQSLWLQDVRILQSSITTDAETEGFQTLFIADRNCSNFYKILSDSRITLRGIRTLGKRIDSMVRQIKLLELLCSVTQIEAFLDGKIHDLEVVESTTNSQILESRIKKKSILYYL